jgi:hypothetical protein
MGTRVRVTFDQAVAGVSPSSFRLADAYGLRVLGSVTYSRDTKTARFIPAAPLEAGMRYKVTLTSGIRNGLGARMSATSWAFTVAGSLSPSITAYVPAADLDLGAGTNTGYRFTVDGSLVASKDASLPEATTVSTTLRRTIANQEGTWFYVASGTWKGYWLRESSAAHLSGATGADEWDAQVFDPPRHVAIRRGTHTGYTFDAAGVMTTSKTVTVGYRRDSTTELRALPGQTGLWFRITSGAWTGYWMRASAVVRLITG